MDPFFGLTWWYMRPRLTRGQRSLITQLPQDPIPDIFGDRDVFLLENLRLQRLLATTEGNWGDRGRVVTVEPDAAENIENIVGAWGVASPWFTMEESSEGTVKSVKWLQDTLIPHVYTRLLLDWDSFKLPLNKIK